jgi:hypothetical protein
MTTMSLGEQTAEGDVAVLLRIYLEDHLAGAVAGTRRMRRLADAERDSPDGPTLKRLADEIEDDLTALREVIEHVGVVPRTYKRWLARIVEFIGLLKLNGRLFTRSPLTTLVEVEVMLVAARGKLAGWETLRAALGTPVVGSVHLDDLIEQGRAHLETLAAVHERAAIAALGTVTIS